MSRGRRLKLGAAVACLVCAATLVPPTEIRADITSISGSGAAATQFLAHGSGDRFWLARVESADGAAGAHTTIFVRGAGEGRWKELRRLDGRATALAHRGTRLALLFEGGGWLLVSDEAVATGRQVPSGTLVDVATRGEALLGLSKVPLPPAATPQKASVTTRAATAPATTSSSVDFPVTPYRLLLFGIESGDWSAAAAPLDVVAGGREPSLAVVDHVPYVAVATGPRAVEVYRQNGHGWDRHAAVHLGGDLREFALLGGGAVPVLLTQEWDAGRPALLHWVRNASPQAVPVEAPPDARAYVAAAAVAIGKVRVLFATLEEMKLLERSYDLLPAAAAASGTSGAAPVPAQVVLPAPPLSPLVMVWARALVTAALLFTIVASVGRRRQMQETMQAAHQLPLAPPGRRLMAGLIDALPVFAGVAVCVRGGGWAGDAPLEQAGLLALVAGALLYLLHTTATEVATGRTLGKLCFGLRVVGLDGGRARPGALLARNLLRVIDLSVAFFPLVLVLYSPLRQRAGDVAAGTLVVLNKPTAEQSGAGKDKSQEPADARD